MPPPRLALRLFNSVTPLYTTPRCLRCPRTRLPQSHHRRPFSSSSNSAAQTITTPPPGNVYFPPPQPPHYPDRIFRNRIYFLLSLFIGYTSLTISLLIAFPPPLPSPGTPEDALLVQYLDDYIDQNTYTRFLRGETAAQPYEPHPPIDSKAAARKKLVLSPPLESGDGVWVELSPFPPAGRTLVSESLAGPRGVGVQRVFWNRRARELVVVVLLGGGLCGWPGVTHGGAIGTVVVDAMRRLAEMVVEEGDGGLGEPRSLQLSYLRPTKANRVHVLRATVTPGRVASEGSINAREEGVSENPAAKVVEVLRSGGGLDTTRPDFSEVASPPQPLEPIGGVQGRLSPEKDMTRQTPPVEMERERVVELDCTLETERGVICVKGKATWAADAFKGLGGT